MKPESLNELALFAGAGGGILGGKLLGWKTICAVENDPFSRDVLVARQNDGCLAPFPIWDDVRTFDGRPWRGRVDVVSGGFPCQDISAAGKGIGLDGARSGMWFEMRRIVEEARPRYVLIENSPMLASARGIKGWMLQMVDSLFGTVRDRREIALRKQPDVVRILEELSEMGYDAKWGIIGAHEAGAPHKRDRIWILAELPNTDRLDADDGRHRASEDSGEFEASEELCGIQEDVADTDGLERGKQQQLEIGKRARPRDESGGSGENVSDALQLGGQVSPAGEQPAEQLIGSNGSPPRYRRGDWWAAEPDVGRVVNGMAVRVDRLRLIGNGQVSAVVRIARNALRLEDDNEDQR